MKLNFEGLLLTMSILEIFKCDIQRSVWCKNRFQHRLHWLVIRELHSVLLHNVCHCNVQLQLCNATTWQEKYGLCSLTSTGVNVTLTKAHATAKPKWQ